MNSPKMMALAIALTLASAATAWADDPPPKPLRLIGEAPSAKDAVPQHFVIDATTKPGDGEFQTELGGWFSGLDGDTPTGGEITGSCVEKHCALTISTDDGKLALTGDILDATGAAPIRFQLKDDDGKVLQQGAGTVRPLAGDIPGHGALAAPGAVDSMQLDDLLLWAHQTVGFGGDEPGQPIGDFQRDALKTWQGANSRPATGLLFDADVAQLTTEGAAARKAAGWTVLGDADHGWSAGYPAALLPKASHAGAEQRFASADGKAVLVIAVDPPMTDSAFDDFVHGAMADKDGRTGVNYTRVNGDLEMRYEEKGVATVAAWHNREGGLARLVFTYPVAANDTYGAYDEIFSRSFKVKDEVKR